MAWTEQQVFFIDFEGSVPSGVLEYGVVTVHRGRRDRRGDAALRAHGAHTPRGHGNPPPARGRARPPGALLRRLGAFCAVPGERPACRPPRGSRELAHPRDLALSPELARLRPAGLPGDRLGPVDRHGAHLRPALRKARFDAPGIPGQRRAGSRASSTPWPRAIAPWAGGSTTPPSTTPLPGRSSSSRWPGSPSWHRFRSRSSLR